MLVAKMYTTKICLYSQHFILKIKNTVFLECLPETLLRNQSCPGHSGWETTSDSPEGPLFQNPIRQNLEQYYLCVCVHIYYIANEQIAAMWHGLVV